MNLPRNHMQYIYVYLGDFNAEMSNTPQYLT